MREIDLPNHVLIMVTWFATHDLARKSIWSTAILRFLHPARACAVSHLLKVAELLVAPEALEVVEGVDVVEGVAVVGLRQGERPVVLMGRLGR